MPAIRLYAERSCVSVCERENVYYLESSEEHFHVIHNQWDSINPFRMLNAGNHVNFKVFSDDDGDDDDWYDNFVTPLASNVYLYAYMWVSVRACVLRIFQIWWE